MEFTPNIKLLNQSKSHVSYLRRLNLLPPPICVNWPCPKRHLPMIVAPFAGQWQNLLASTWAWAMRRLSSHGMSWMAALKVAHIVPIVQMVNPLWWCIFPTVFHNFVSFRTNVLFVALWWCFCFNMHGGVWFFGQASKEAMQTVYKKALNLWWRLYHWPRAKEKAKYVKVTCILTNTQYFLSLEHLMKKTL